MREVPAHKEQMRDLFRKPEAGGGGGPKGMWEDNGRGKWPMWKRRSWVLGKGWWLVVVLQAMLPGTASTTEPRKRGGKREELRFAGTGGEKGWLLELCMPPKVIHDSKKKS